MNRICINTILLTAVVGILAALCFGFSMPSSSAPTMTTIAYVKGIGTESWKAVPCVDVSIAGNIATIHSQSGLKYITSINNVVIQR